MAASRLAGFSSHSSASWSARMSAASVSRFALAQSRRTARIVNMYFGMASVLLPSRRRPFASPSKLCGAESSVASAAPEMTAARRADDDPTFTGS